MVFTTELLKNLNIFFINLVTLLVYDIEFERQILHLLFVIIIKVFIWIPISFTL